MEEKESEEEGRKLFQGVNLHLIPCLLRPTRLRADPARAFTHVLLLRRSPCLEPLPFQKIAWFKPLPLLKTLPGLQRGLVRIAYLDLNLCLDWNVAWLGTLPDLMR